MARDRAEIRKDDDLGMFSWSHGVSGFGDAGKYSGGGRGGLAEFTPESVLIDAIGAELMARSA